MTLLNGVDRHLDRAVAGHQDDRHSRMMLLAPAQQLQAILVLQANIDGVPDLHGLRSIERVASAMVAAVSTW